MTIVILGLAIGCVLGLMWLTWLVAGMRCEDAESRREHRQHRAEISAELARIDQGLAGLKRDGWGL